MVMTNGVYQKVLWSLSIPSWSPLTTYQYPIYCSFTIALDASNRNTQAVYLQI